MKQGQANLSTSSSTSDISLKYQSNNVIVKKLTTGFLDNFCNLLKLTNPRKVIELGAGEGYLSLLIADKFPHAKIISSDVNSKELDSRKNNLKKTSNVTLKIVDAKRIPFKDNTFDLVVCSEVLEHIPNPQKAINEIYRVTSRYALLSVPNEPIFHLLNLFRGKYITTLGNYPDHVNHWSVSSFINFVTKSGFIVKILKKSFPWILLLVEK